MTSWSPTNRLWRRIQESKVAQNTLSMLTAGAVTMMLQGVYFVMIARSLGPEQYGAFIGVTALIAVLAPFSALGVGNVLVRNVSRDKKCFRESWGNAILATAVLGSLLLVLVLASSPFILSAKVPLTLVFLVGLSDLILGGIVSLAGLAFQAVEMLGKTAQVTATLSGIRATAAVAMFVSISRPSAVSWAGLYLASSSVGVAYALFVVSRRLGYPRLAIRRLRSEVVEGFRFSVGVSSMAVYNNIDKSLLVRLGTLNAAGFYGIAYRLVDLAFQPVGALQASAYSRFFQRGSEGITGSFRYAKRLLPLAAAYSVFA